MRKEKVQILLFRWFASKKILMDEELQENTL